MDALLHNPEEQTLDPSDWKAFRTQAHGMLDDMLDYTQSIRQRPVWQPIPDEVRARFRGVTVPLGPSPLAEVHQEFMNYILPFAVGNAHPGFMGWVHGGGTAVGMLAEMLAAGLNANLGGRDQVPIEVEHQIAEWMRQLFGFPESAAGLFVTGTSMANFIAVVIARDAALGFDVRNQGVAAKPQRLTAYSSTAVHGCIAKAMDLSGVGSTALRLIPTGSGRRIDVKALENAIKKDREAGFTPFLVVGTAGTVDTGAIDDLAALADLAAREKLWFHVDGAYGALAILAPDLAPRLAGIERADSLAFDFHKWGQVPYDAGFILVRDGGLQRHAFAASSAYLRRETRGLAAGPSWPCDFGPDLSRGFRALKAWFTLKVYGTQALGAVISRTCALARYLEQRIANAWDLEALAPVELNVVCFRYRADDSDRVNADIVADLQESGSVAPSTTMINGRLAIRVAIVNHRTGQADIDRLLERTLALGRNSGKGRGKTAPATGVVPAPSTPRAKWEAELQQIEGSLAANPGAIDLRVRRAFLLSELGRLVDSRNEYIKVLEREPHHLAALNNLGSVLMGTGHRSAARIAYKEAILRHPNDPMSRVNFGNLLLEESEILTAHGQDKEALQLKREAREHFEQALRVRADYEKAHEGLSYILDDLGDEEQADWHRCRAFQRRFLIPVPYRGGSTPLPVLYLTSTTGGNVRLQRFLDDRIFQTFVVATEFYDRRTPLPAHQLVVNAIGDTEVSSKALVAAESLLAMTDAPVINPPAAVLATSRSNNANRLSGVPGVVTPITATLPREQLSGSGAEEAFAGHGLVFPLLLRAPGFHTGQHFLRVETLAALPVALAELPGKELIVMQYLDARGPDGKSRKYRAMMIDGQIYPLHVAISSHWKIHYFTAEMADNPDHRSEDAAFLENMAAAIGPLAMDALRRIQSTLGLDYAGIDFGLSARGEVLLFEANATMVVNRPDPDERWNYRLPAYQRIHTAVQNMLVQRASMGPKRSGTIASPWRESPAALKTDEEAFIRAARLGVPAP
ncbi:MAG TPA: pyridoxal-dependent decarboxylase [Terriglobales bacterium]|nr:pyridoxal-dependent decarboxylase [Terriglobales bacterium]